MAAVMASVARQAVWRASGRSSWPPKSPFCAPINQHHQPGPAEPYVEDQHFRVVTREPGSYCRDIPIFASSPGVVTFEDVAGACVRVDIPQVPGAFLLQNLVTPSECAALIRLSEAMGYTEDAPVSLGRDVRHNENCVWIADDSLTGRKAYSTPTALLCLLDKYALLLGYWYLIDGRGVCSS